MAKARTVWTNEADYARALALERKALRAVIRTLLASEMPYEKVRKLCYRAMNELFVPATQAPVETPGLDFLASEALECIDTVIDEMVERPDPRG